ncbi:hypothetical protein C2G38_2090548 [Gigaspora rosea]|uniref:Uncharacterized protein n=1 Tax=Gigaspora rosea TaxID=44941 RepID=A0A397VBB5_9GLOM|nr:hypothetical protein C2G38_2090548 [Gigaspora rosea]
MIYSLRILINCTNKSNKNSINFCSKMLSYHFLFYIFQNIFINALFIIKVLFISK